MSTRTEQEFEDLLEQFISDMERVKCPLADFLAALKDARSRLSERIAQVTEELGEDE